MKSPDKKIDLDVRENNEVEDILNSFESNPDEVYKVLEESPEAMSQFQAILLLKRGGRWKRIRI